MRKRNTCELHFDNELFVCQIEDKIVSIETERCRFVAYVDRLQARSTRYGNPTEGGITVRERGGVVRAEGDNPLNRQSGRGDQIC